MFRVTVSTVVTALGLLAGSFFYSPQANALCVCHTMVHDGCNNRCQNCCPDTPGAATNGQELFLDLDALTKSGYTLRIKFPEELEGLELGNGSVVNPKTGEIIRQGSSGGYVPSAQPLPSRKVKKI